MAPEALVVEWLGEESAAARPVIYGDPFYVPYDRLAALDGWILWLGHPPIPEDLPILPAPEHLLWDDPRTAVAAALLISADYAVRRGATDSTAAAAILEREGPIVIITPDGVHRSLSPLLRRAEEAGLPVLAGPGYSTPEEIREAVSAFAARSRAHAVDLGRRHDPVLSFQPRATDAVIGGDNLSTFLVHDGGTRDGTRVTGELGPRLAIDIGLPPDDYDVTATARLEPLLAAIPCFLDGVTSWRQGEGLAIGWRIGEEVTPAQLALAFHTWTKALTGAEFADVQLAFADLSASGQFDLLRRRADRYGGFRAAVLAGNPDPRGAVDREIIE